MKKPWLTVTLITFLFLSGLIVIALVANPRGPREPEYHGKKLTAWLADLEGGPGSGPGSTAYTNAALAIHQMGTNAVPFLLQMFQTKDSALKLESANLLGNAQHWVHFHFSNALKEHDEASRALGILGPAARVAIPDLAHLLNSGDASDKNNGRNYPF